MSIFIVGCGYLGERVAREISSLGVSTHALTRQKERAQQFQQYGWHPHLGDWTQRESLNSLPVVDTLLIAVTHRALDNVPAVLTHVSGLQNLFQQLPHIPARIVYISTTGVYAQDDGSWVDEESVCAPTRPGGIAALAAECWLRERFSPDQLTILRMAGLYGPQRVPNAERMRLKIALSNNDQSFLNLIHIDDAVGYSLEALTQPHPLPLYLVSDGHPIPRAQYYQFLAELLQLETDTTVAEPVSAITPPRRSESNKRINCGKLREHFAYRCQYDDFRQGVRASLREP